MQSGTTMEPAAVGNPRRAIEHVEAGGKGSRAARHPGAAARTAAVPRGCRTGGPGQKLQA